MTFTPMPFMIMPPSRPRRNFLTTGLLVLAALLFVSAICYMIALIIIWLLALPPFVALLFLALGVAILGVILIN